LIDYLRRCEEILREKHAKPLGRFRWFSNSSIDWKLDCGEAICAYPEKWLDYSRNL
jgi:hypothetical protein